MNENIDLTKILEGCPVGTKFYSSVYGKVDFSRIISDDYGKCPIELMGYNKCTHSIAAVYCEKDGTFNCDYEESLINEVRDLLNSNGIFYNFHMSTVMYPQDFFKSLTLIF